MKHMKNISKARPAKADIFGHPNILESIGGFLKEPLRIIGAHIEGVFDFLFGWI